MLPAVTDAPDGWSGRNAFLDEVPEKLKVAETLKEFRGEHLYNLLRRERARASAREVPQIWQWDDHEVINNWSDAQGPAADAALHREDACSAAGRARRPRLPRVRADALARAGRGASASTATSPTAAMLDVFVIDMRSYRGANSYNRQTDARRRHRVPRRRSSSPG